MLIALDAYLQSAFPRTQELLKAGFVIPQSISIQSFSQMFTVFLLCVTWYFRLSTGHWY